MKIILTFVTVLCADLSRSATLLKLTELTEELINDPRYLLWENEEGLVEVEDLQSNETADIALFVTENDVSFYVYTCANPLNSVQIRESQLKDIVRLTGFNISKPTLVVIHGWKNNYKSPVNEKIKNDALLTHDINVLIVDWSPIAQGFYIPAQRSVLAVGNYIGDFLLKLDDELHYHIQKLTIVGHSLGAHIAGNAGARTHGLIETIIGLDPAGPLFTQRNINNRLDPTDGKYVHVIHTNRPWFTRMLGSSIIMGHVDYFPNGGYIQPGCGKDLLGQCAHSRAYEYFAESLYNDKFSSKICDSYKNYNGHRCDDNDRSNMGGYPIKHARHGKYYLTTNNKSPFARG